MVMTTRFAYAAICAGLLIVGGAFVGGSTGQAQSQKPDELAGVWIEPTGGGAIELKPCGTGLCGTIVWLKEPVDRSGRPVLDVNNPDPAKRRQRMCNLQLIGGGSRLADGRLEKGWIYNPEDGQRYDVDIQRIDQDRLRVHGYLGMKFLGETFTWRRAPDGLKRCDA
jgi:uncharacterized protein (DUF2147 family)